MDVLQKQKHEQESGFLQYNYEQVFDGSLGICLNGNGYYWDCAKDSWVNIKHLCWTHSTRFCKCDYIKDFRLDILVT